MFVQEPCELRPSGKLPFEHEDGEEDELLLSELHTQTLPVSAQRTLVRNIFVIKTDKSKDTGTILVVGRL